MLGDPIDHSMSPVIQSAALAAAGITGTYEARRVDAAGMRQAVEEIRSGSLDGANVTMPHKRLAAKLSDRVERLAARGGVANTLVREDGEVVGHNTDIPGIKTAWVAAGLPGDGPVVVLGAGGAAAAALLALEGRDLFVQARAAERAEDLVQRLGVEARVMTWAAPPHDGATIVNATPIGMHGEQLPRTLTERAAGLFDMAYGADVTSAVSEARRAGIPAAAGLDMLLAQAAESFRLWTGEVADRAAMAAALDEIRPGGRAAS